jgi:membrane protease YdiL (CAAX protease family)
MAASNVSILQDTERHEAIAPWWHTAVMIAAIGALSAWSAHQGGLVHIDLPGISQRLSSYLTVLSIEWLLILAIWIPLRQRGRTVASVVSGRWKTVGAFFRDFGLGIGFFALVAIPISALANRFAGHPQSSATIEMLPKTWVEAVMWIALSATAGFCEEFVFRGYLTEQFRAWTGSAALAIMGQAVVFGLAHGYYNAGTMVAVMMLGLALGLLAHWRKSLRPGMLGHGFTDALGGVLAFFGIK